MTEQELKEANEKFKTQEEKFQADVKKLEEDQAALKTNQEAADAAPAPKSAAPADEASLTEEQWVSLEAKYGKDRDQLKKDWEFTNAALAPLRNENAQFKGELAADKNVKAAIKAAAGKDSQFSKIEGPVREFIDRLPIEIRSDPKRLAEEMKFAVAYGKGSVPQAQGGGRREAPNVEKKPEAAFTGEEESEELYGKHRDEKRNFTIDVDRKVDKEYRKVNEHSEHHGGVEINHKDEWTKQVTGAKG